MTHKIKEFYSELQFPGHYTIDDFKFYDEAGICNNYMKALDDVIEPWMKILDVGCGSGFVSNFFARRYPTCQFTAIDFSDSIDYAKQFGIDNHIRNVAWKKADVLDFTPYDMYDIIICCGVLHHIPEYIIAMAKMKSYLKPGGTVALAVYNPMGKLFKRFFKIKYHNSILHADQEQNPYETSFSKHYVTDVLCHNYNLKTVTPSWNNRFVDLFALFNSRNGGLALYIFKDE